MDLNQKSKSSKKIEKSLPLDYEFFWGQKYFLKLKKIDNSTVCSIADKFNLSFPIAKVLCSRGFSTDEQISSFLFSSFEKDVASPLLLKDSLVAVNRILLALEKNEKILIFGDYDVDGITSTSLLLVGLIPLGANVNYFLPNREVDGYGLSKRVVKNGAESGYKLIITVDNGITAFDASQEAKNQKIDLIITDHHRPHKKLPHALAIIDPYQNDCEYPYKNLPGVGVAFKLLSLLYEIKGLELPQKVYELLTLGIVADVMPLTGENRFWVQYGLSKINKKRSFALNLLAINGKAEKAVLNSLDIGFKIAPQLNALGRLSDSRDAVKFLISNNKDEVEGIAKTLLEMNEARKKVEREIYEEIICAINLKKINLEKENIIMASGMHWPSGVIGLVAGRLMHSFGKPTFLFHLQKDGTLKGSCRSIREFDIFDALTSVQDLLISFGGHSFAAGLKLEQKNLPLLKKNLEEKIAKDLSSYDLLQKVGLDCDLDLADVNVRLVEDIARLEPFGNQNEQPIFLVKNVTLLKSPQILKDKHIKISIFSNGVIKPVIFFDRPELFSVFKEIGENSFSFAGKINVNEWQGRKSIEFEGIDIVV